MGEYDEKPVDEQRFTQYIYCIQVGSCAFGEFLAMIVGTDVGQRRLAPDRSYRRNHEKL